LRRRERACAFRPRRRSVDAGHGLAEAHEQEVAVQIKDVISPSHLMSVDEDDSVSVAIQVMFGEEIRHLPVTREGRIVGVVSERDLLACRASSPHLPCDQPVKAIMSHPAVVVAPEAPVEDGVALMLRRRLGCLPVVDDTELVGIVTRTDLLRHWPPPRVRAHVEASRHPSARTARDVMSASPLQVRQSDELALAAQIMAHAATRHLPVVGGAGEVVGVVSERDILRHRVVRGEAGTRDCVGVAMSHPAVTVDAGETLAMAETLVLSRRIGCLPVVEQGRLVGMLTTTDLVRGALDRELERTASEQPRQVGAVMRREPAGVTPDALLLDAVATMVARRTHQLPVVDAGGHVVGMLSDQDIRAAAGEPARVLQDAHARVRLRETRVSAVMKTPALTVRAAATVAEAADLLVEEDVAALPVVDEQGRLVGVVTYVDIIRALL
jgi:CBS domain-containing protein